MDKNTEINLKKLNKMEENKMKKLLPNLDLKFINENEQFNEVAFDEILESVIKDDSYKSKDDIEFDEMLESVIKDDDLTFDFKLPDINNI